MPPERPPLGGLEVNAAPKRRGRPPKPLSERAIQRTTEIVRPTRTYSARKKRDVLVYLYHHRVRRNPSDNSRERQVPPDMTLEDGYRLASFQEASKHFLVPAATVKTWWDKRDVIWNAPAKLTRKKKLPAVVASAADTPDGVLETEEATGT